MYILQFIRPFYAIAQGIDIDLTCPQQKKNAVSKQLCQHIPTRVSSGIPSEFFPGSPSQCFTEFRSAEFHGIE